jgi:CBS domain-containing membrane protein
LEPRQRAYPFRQPGGAGEAQAALRFGLDTGELVDILETYRQASNVGVADLARLVAAAEQAVASRHLRETLCAEIMSADLVTVAPDAPVGRVAELFGLQGFTSIPVVGDDAILLGVIFQIDVIAAERAEIAGDGRRCARDTMRRGLPSVAPDTPVSALLPLLANGGPEAVPVQSEGRIVGIVTRTDLISELARRLARETPGQS